MRSLVAILFLSILAFSLPTPSLAVLPDEMLADPNLEARARVISKDIRCLVCQNQSIDDSDAGLARDLRILIRERLTEGDDNQQVRDYLVARYGEYVLLDPPMRTGTLLLWGSPALLVVIGAIAVVVWYRGLGRRAAPAGAALSADEEARLASLLGDKDKADRG